MEAIMEISPTEHYSVLIVDDHPLMRRGVRQLLELEQCFTVVGEASNGSEAIGLLPRLNPDIILLDLNMKGLSGLDTLKALQPETQARIIVLTVSDSRNDIYSLVDAGANGYLLKDTEPEELLSLIRQAAHGDNVFSERVAEHLSSRHTTTDPFAGLTERELGVLQQVARGMSNKQVATQLFISEETVKVHIRNILRKLNVHSRVAATIMYLEYKSR